MNNRMLQIFNATARNTRLGAAGVAALSPLKCARRSWQPYQQVAKRRAQRGPCTAVKGYRSRRRIPCKP